MKHSPRPAASAATAASRGGRLRPAVALLGAAVLLLSGACSVKTNGGSGSTAKADGSITMSADDGSPTFEDNFNPFSPSHRTGATYMYEPLQVINTIDGKATPFLASKVSTPDASTAVFTIRSGVQWTDGQKFTAKDVAYTFNLIKQKADLDTLGVWQHIKSFDVSGDTVTFHYKTADVPATNIISQQLIVPEHIWKDVKDPLTWPNTDPVSTGPYVIDKFTPNQYTMKKNPKYWQADKVAIDKLVIPATNTQLEIVNKQYEWAYSFMNDVEKTWVGSNPKNNSYWFPPGGTVALFPNLTKAPFSNVHFRKGLSYSLDRKKVADDAEEGYVDPAGETGLLLPNQKDWLDPSIPDGGKITQDAAKATDEFKQAGYTLKNGKLVDSTGKQVTVTITTANGYTDWLQGVNTVSSQLTKAGIAVKIEQPQPAGYQAALNNGQYELAVGSFGGSGSIFSDFNNLLNSEFATPVGTSTAANWERFKDPQADKLLAQLKAEQDPATQREIVHQLQNIVYDQVPVISLFYGGFWGLFSSTEFTGWPSEKDPYAPPVQWASTPLLVFTHVTKVS